MPVGNWQPLSLGMEQQTLRPGGIYTFSSFAALRIDPAHYTFRVGYTPGVARSLDQWRATLPGAVALINANFFDGNNYALGLAVADGVVYGTSYTDRGGMLAVQNGIVRVRSTIDEPYFGEPLEQAAQAFPNLVLNGAQAYANARPDRASRRTVVGQDAQGQIIFLASSSLIGMTLVDLSAWLPTTELGLMTAVNMDGGGSSLLWAQGGPSVPSFDPVPVVIAVYPRG
jgi:exopolysaccharide biosynthesis protein